MLTPSYLPKCRQTTRVGLWLHRMYSRRCTRGSHMSAKQKGENKLIKSLISKIGELEKTLPKSTKRKVKRTKQGVKRVSQVAGELGGHVDVMRRVIRTCMTPHDTSIIPAGLPTFPNDPSVKATAISEIDIVSGATPGVAIVGITPVITNDAVAFIYSSATTFAGTTVPALNSAATGTATGTMSGLPYANAALGANLEGRVVSVGIEAWYSGTFNNCGGTIAMCSHPDWGDLTGYTQSQLAQFKTVKPEQVTMGQKYYASMTIPDYNFASYGTTGQVTGSAAVVPFALMFTGSGSTSLHVRITQVVEYSGRSVHAISTSNPIPPSGAMEHVMAVCKKTHEHKSRVSSHTTEDLVQHAFHLFSQASHVKIGGKPLGEIARKAMPVAGGLMRAMGAVALL